MLQPRQVQFVVGLVGITALVAGFATRSPVLRWVGVGALLVSLLLFAVLRDR